MISPTTTAEVRVPIKTMRLEIAENTLLVLINGSYFVPVTNDNVEHVLHAFTTNDDVVLDARKATRRLPLFTAKISDTEIPLVLTFVSAMERRAFRNYLRTAPELQAALN